MKREFTMAIGTPTSRAYRPARTKPGGVAYGPKGNYSAPRTTPANRNAAPLGVIPGGAKKGLPSPARLPVARAAYAALTLLEMYGAPSKVSFPKAYGRGPLGLANGVFAQKNFGVGFGEPALDQDYTVQDLVNLPRVPDVVIYDTFLRLRPEVGPLFADFLITYVIPGLAKVRGYELLPNPFADPYAVPRPNMLPEPITFPMAPPMEDPEQDPDYQPSPLRPPPRPEAPLAPISAIGFNVGPLGLQQNSPKGRPPRGTPERKSKSQGAAAIFWVAFNMFTEAGDFLEAVLAGFGLQVSGYKNMVNTLLDILENPSGYSFDLGAFAAALVYNEIEDKIVGSAMGHVRKGLRAAGIKVYGGVTPGTGFF